MSCFICYMFLLPNHEYGSNIRAEIAELFFVDTTPFVDAYFLNPQGQSYDWRGVSPRESYLQTILKVLENT